MRTVVNPVVRALVRTTFGRRSGRLSLLRFEGRRTGRMYVVPVLLHVIDGLPTAFADGAWAANFRGGQPLTVVGRGRESAAVGAVVEDPRIVGTAMRSAIAERGGARMLGLHIDAGHVPTDAELFAVRSMVRIRLV